MSAPEPAREAQRWFRQGEEDLSAASALRMAETVLAAARDRLTG
jgi:hypothetical protein